MRPLIVILSLYSSFIYTQTVKIDTNSILIGEQIDLKIKSHVDSVTLWPISYDSLIEGIEIINIQTPDTNDEYITQKIKITAWDTGNYYIPSIRFSENNISDSILLTVNTVLLEENPTLKDIKDPLRAPFSWTDIWLWILVLILILATIILTKRILRDKNKKLETKPKIKTPPYIIALEKLKELESKKLWQGGRIKEYHSEISEIIRRYIEEYFMFNALELTTDEILNSIKKKIAEKELNNLNVILIRSDLAKFAKTRPIEDENIESIKLATEFILVTKELYNHA